MRRLRNDAASHCEADGVRELHPAEQRNRDRAIEPGPPCRHCSGVRLMKVKFKECARISVGGVSARRDSLHAACATAPSSSAVADTISAAANSRLEKAALFEAVHKASSDSVAGPSR